MISPTDLHLRLIGWRLSQHASMRMRTRGVSAGKLVDALSCPDLTYPSGAETIFVRDRLAAVVNSRTHVVLTVLLTGSQTWTDTDAWAALTA